MAQNKGNPNHAPKGAPGGTGGQFVSGPESGAEPVAETKKKKASASTAKKKAPFRKKVQVDLSKLDSMFAKLQDLNQAISVGPLSTAEELEQNIEKLFSKKVIGHIDRLYGKGNEYEKGIFHPESNPNMNLNLFTCVLGKYRYPDNHARFIPEDEFNKLAADKEHYTMVFRGFTSEGEKRRKILKGYGTIDIDNIDIYGNGVYGTNVYTSTTYEYSLRHYAGGNPNKVLHCLVDRNARKVFTGDLQRECNQKLKSHYDYNLHKEVETPLMTSIKTKFEQHLINNGIEQTRAHSMAKDFGKSLENDVSLFAVLLGYDYQVSESGNQRNILNLNKWIINANRTGV